jgi:DNA polymerase delta subunit 1
MGMFVTQKKTCLACKKEVKSGTAVCKDCGSKRKRILIERQLELNSAQSRCADLWVNCQRCQGSLHEEVLCQNKDCPIYYRRAKALKDVEDAEQIIKRFSINE